MSIEEFNNQLKECKNVIYSFCGCEEEIKNTFLKLFDLYLKKEQGWRNTDDFKEVIKNL